MNHWNPHQSPPVAYLDRGEGPTLVLLHAFPQSSAMWRPQLEVLSDRFRVLAPDLPGFGKSGLVPGWTVDSAADLLAEFLDAVEPSGSVVLGGLSMGGYLALAFARRHPGKLRGLILADTRAEPDGEEARANRDRMISFALEHGSAAVIDSMIGKMVSDKTRTERHGVVEDVKQIASGQRAEAIVAALEALRDRPDAVPGLKAISVPTLVIVGEDDVLTPPTLAKKLAEMIPGATLTILPEAGHLSNLEVPEKFNAAVREFLQNQVPVA